MAPSDFKSRDLQTASQSIKNLNNPEVNRAFNGLASILTQGEWAESTGSGYSMRSGVGFAVRSIINGRKIRPGEDHIGAEIFQNIRTEFKYYPDALKQLNALEDSLRAATGNPPRMVLPDAKAHPVQPLQSNPVPTVTEPTNAPHAALINEKPVTLEPGQSSHSHTIAQNASGLHADHIGAAEAAAGVALDIADGDYGKAAQGTVTAAATSQTGLELAGKGLGSVFHTAGNFAKHIPVLGAAVTVGFVGAEVIGDIADGDYGRAAAATLAGAGEAAVNMTPAGLFGGGDATREGIRAAVGATFGEQYEPDKSGLRQMGEQAGNLISSHLQKQEIQDFVYPKNAIDRQDSITPVFQSRASGRFIEPMHIKYADPVPLFAPAI